MAGFQNNVLPHVTGSVPVFGRSSVKQRRTAIQSVVQAISAPQRPKEEQAAGDSIRLLDLDNAERARLESTDAFSELVALSNKNGPKQSVNRRQKVRDQRTRLQLSHPYSQHPRS